jgi:hypothetical protein
MTKSRIIRDPEGLGNALKSAVRMLGSQENAATAAKIDQGAVSRVLRGEVKRLTGRVAALCEYAKIDPEPYLFDGSRPTEKEMIRAMRSATRGEGSREAIVHQMLLLLGKLDVR